MLHSSTKAEFYEDVSGGLAVGGWRQGDQSGRCDRHRYVTSEEDRTDECACVVVGCGPGAVGNTKGLGRPPTVSFSLARVIFICYTSGKTCANY